MARLAQDWILGWLKCEACGFEWNAAVDDLPQYSLAVVIIVTGVKPFQAPCPQCGKKNCRLVEVCGT